MDLASIPFLRPAYRPEGKEQCGPANNFLQNPPGLHRNIYYDPQSEKQDAQRSRRVTDRTSTNPARPDSTQCYCHSNPAGHIRKRTGHAGLGAVAGGGGRAPEGGFDRHPGGQSGGTGSGRGGPLSGGLAPVVFMTRGQLERPELLADLPIDDTGTWGLTQRILTGHGVPAEAIVMDSGFVDSTIEEAKRVRTLIRHGPRKVPDPGHLPVPFPARPDYLPPHPGTGYRTYQPAQPL